jgi:hypothetical protein
MARAVPQEDWPHTIAEFQAWHARQPGRWEFIDGWPRLMAPASMTHTIIENNAGFTLRQALAELGCIALVDGPQIVTDQISAIPDALVTCAPLTSRRRWSPNPPSSSRSCFRRARPTTRAANGSATRRSRASSTT